MAVKNPHSVKQQKEISLVFKFWNLSYSMNLNLSLVSDRMPQAFR